VCFCDIRLAFFPDAVLHVIYLRADEKVFGIKTPRIVAAMEHKKRGTEVKFQPEMGGKSMNELSFTSIAFYSVSIFVHASSPIPATSFINQNPVDHWHSWPTAIHLVPPLNLCGEQWVPRRWYSVLTRPTLAGSPRLPTVFIFSGLARRSSAHFTTPARVRVRFDGPGLDRYRRTSPRLYRRWRPTQMQDIFPLATR
jgi:hypothetical protein